LHRMGTLGEGVMVGRPKKKTDESFVPCLSIAQAAPLKAAVMYAAENMDLTPRQTMMVLTYILEGVALELAKGSVVNIPSFGAFFPYARKHRLDPDTLYVWPRFIPSIGLRRFVTDRCPPGAAKNKQELNYRLNHHPSHGRERAYTTTGLAKMRQAIRAQARREGEDLG
jgi:hypothetical protein